MRQAIQQLLGTLASNPKLTERQRSTVKKIAGRSYLRPQFWGSWADLQLSVTTDIRALASIIEEILK